MSFKKKDGKFASKRKFFEDKEGNFQPKMRKIEDDEVSFPGHASKGVFGGVDMEEEAMLEKLVIGDLSSMLERLGEDDNIYPRLNLDSDDSGVEDSINTLDDEPKPTTSYVPAWHDEEDSNLCIQDAIQKQNRKGTFHFPGTATNAFSGILKNNFCNLVGTPNWAKLDTIEDSDSSDSDDEDGIVRHANKFLSKSSSNLPREEIKMTRVKNLNHETKCEGYLVTSVQFHPKSTVGLVAGTKGIASIVQVDGEHNKNLQSVVFPGFPIKSAKFTTSGDQFIVGSHKPYFYRYDMIEGHELKVTPHSSVTITQYENFEVSPNGQHIAVVGRFGYIHLLCARTNECIGTLKMNDNAKVLAFSADGSKLFSYGSLGEVYVWDIASRMCLFRFVDEGCVEGTALAISPNEQFLATGSSHGVVNIYETSSLGKETNTPTPCKTLYNLTTAISSLSFNPSSEILLMMSKKKDNAIRLAHFPSMTVFKNFPMGYHINIPQASAFSPQSGYLSLSNNKGKALLFRLQHYGSY